MATVAKMLLLFLALALFSQYATSNEVMLNALRKEIDILVQELEKSNGYVEGLTKKLGVLTRQVMLQQLFLEERLRSEGQSGLKQIRVNNAGTKSYYSSSHVGRSVAAIHDHSNNIRTVGMGELIAVLNGVEFRTRHNDYRLFMPNTTSGDYHATEPIPFPDVPPEVTEKKNITEQVAEMKEWFKAWQASDHTVRDYRKYFKPVLCYLEGTWTKNSKSIDEPFESDRHFVDAKSWFDLQEKIRFTSYTGRKDNLENFAYLPTTIMETVNETTAVFAQWNYRIMCHPLKSDIPLNRFRLVDDIGSRLRFHHTTEEQTKTRAARFQINPDNKHYWYEKVTQYTFLDKLMSQIPGKDNYPANLSDDSLGQAALSMDPDNDGQLLNAGYYHRRYKVSEKGAMGVQVRRRGYSDPSVFMAMNSQNKVAGMKIDVCQGRGRKRKCVKKEQKWSYAIPLEIIYMTPLNSWNPYNLTYKGKFNTPEGKTVIANGRNGQRTKEKAFDGVNSKLYYLTPNEFFTGGENQRDAADTARQSVGVLDPAGEVRTVRASGTRIFFPKIPGIGTVRQRYPIMPIHAEGSTTWKELEAVQDILMDSQTHARLLREPLAKESSTENNTDTKLLTGPSTKRGILPHRHEIILTEQEVEYLKSSFKNSVTKYTDQVQGHQHELTIKWQRGWKRFYILNCGENQPRFCFDYHRGPLTTGPDQ